MSVMKAIVLECHGSSASLHLRDDYPRPKTQPGKILVKVKAFAINHADTMSRKGSGAKGNVPTAEIIGIECIGVVVDVPRDMQRGVDVKENRTGPQGARYRPGDVVAAVMGGLGRSYNGSYAEYALLDPVSVSAPLPGVDPSHTEISTFASLAALPATFLVAHGVLTTSLRVRQDDTILVHGGSSSIGLATASLAKHLYGVQKVVGTTRNAGKTNGMKVAGFDIVLVRPDSDSSVEDQAQKMKEESGETDGFTAQLDLIGADHIRLALACAKSAGGSRVCMAGVLSGAYHVTSPFSPMAIPVGVYLCGYSSSHSAHLDPLSELVAAALDQKFPLNVDRVFKFQEIARAHRYYESGTQCGKVVCTVD